MNSGIDHEAKVISCCERGICLVEIRPAASDSCRGCAMAETCGPKARKGKAIVARARCGHAVCAGETVRVSPARGSTSRAATLLLALPLAGLLAGAVGATLAGLGDAGCAGWALGMTAAGFIPAMLLSRRGRDVLWVVTSPPSP